MSSSLSSWFVTPNNHISSPSSSPLSPPSTPIGVASYGARAPLDFQLFNFSGHFRVAQTLTFDSMWLPTEKKLYMHSLFVTVYYMNFIIFFVSPLNYFPLVLCPPRTKSWWRHWSHLFFISDSKIPVSEIFPYTDQDHWHLTQASSAALTDDGMIRLFIDLFAQPQSPALVFLTLA